MAAKLWPAFGLLVLMAGCGPHNSMPTPKRASHLYVEEVAVPEVATQEQAVQVAIQGNLPSPAYSFERFQVEVKDNLIEITPVVAYDSTKLAAQVLVPFEQVCEVGKLKPGEYQVRIVGKTGLVSKTLRVR